jgi:hypothetical protein
MPIAFNRIIYCFVLLLFISILSGQAAFADEASVVFGVS